MERLNLEMEEEKKQKANNKYMKKNQFQEEYNDFMSKQQVFSYF